MKISILGATNLDKLSTYLGKSVSELETCFNDIGKSLGENSCTAVTVFNISGSLKSVSESCKYHGGRHEILMTKNDYDWDVEPYLSNLPKPSDNIEIVEKKSWHDMLISLVGDYELIIVCGLSLGVMVELGYVKWNVQDKKGSLKKILFIEELLPNGILPPEITLTFNNNFAFVVSVNELLKYIAKDRLI